MNIIIAAVIIQSWISKEQIALFPKDAIENFDILCEFAHDDENQEILDCLEFIESMNMIHILEN